MKEEQLRLEESEADMKKRLKANREHSKKWEAGREDRVGTWRDFAKGNKSKKVGVFLTKALSCIAYRLHDCPLFKTLAFLGS